MANWYVRPDGNDANSGSGYLASQAKQTIQAAYDASSNGDTVYIAPGRYFEQVTLSSTIDGIDWNDMYEFIGDPHCEQFLDMTPGEVIMEGMAENTYNTTYITQGAFTVSGSFYYARWKNICFYDFPKDGYGIWAPTSQTLRYVEVINCKFGTAENPMSAHAIGNSNTNILELRMYGCKCYCTNGAIYTRSGAVVKLWFNEIRTVKNAFWGNEYWGDSSEIMYNKIYNGGIYIPGDTTNVTVGGNYIEAQTNDVIQDGAVRLSGEYNNLKIWGNIMNLRTGSFSPGLYFAESNPSSALIMTFYGNRVVGGGYGIYCLGHGYNAGNSLSFRYNHFTGQLHAFRNQSNNNHNMSFNSNNVIGCGGGVYTNGTSYSITMSGNYLNRVPLSKEGQTANISESGTVGGENSSYKMGFYEENNQLIMRGYKYAPVYQIDVPTKIGEESKVIVDYELENTADKLSLAFEGVNTDFTGSLTGKAELTVTGIKDGYESVLMNGEFSTNTYTRKIKVNSITIQAV